MIVKLLSGIRQGNPDAGVEQEHSVRFPVFTDQLRGVDVRLVVAEFGSELVEQPPGLNSAAVVGRLQLTLREPLQEATPGLLVGASLSVKPLEQVV
jgi:hypothetical protein